MRMYGIKKRRHRSLATGCIPLMAIILLLHLLNNKDQIEPTVTSDGGLKYEGAGIHNNHHYKTINMDFNNKTINLPRIAKDINFPDTRSHDDTTTTTSTSSTETTERSVLLHLLKSLPNNNTQREISNIRVRTSQSGLITLSTQGGVSKLPRLADLTSRWIGPISCAIYITTEEQIDIWIDFLNQNSRKDSITTWVSFHILLEQPQLPKTVNRHPINRLRNLALRNCRTDYVFLNDMDFMPPIHAHDILIQDPLPPPKIFWVLPAFERFATSSKDRAKSIAAVTNVTWIPKDKNELLTSLEAKVVAPFHEYFPAGHAPCDYSRWYNSSTFYSIQYDYLFEPYVIVHRYGLPKFFPNFRGFDFNKMSFFMEAHYLGFQFMVHPNSFVVHMNHGRRKRWIEKGGDSKYIREDFRKYLQQVYQVTKTELARWR
jgi:hypothetical protein